MPGRIEDLRRAYHHRICSDVLRLSEAGAPNNADGGSPASVRLGKGIVENIGIPIVGGKLAGQTAGHRFEEATRDFLREAFGLLSHLRPGEWEFSLGGNVRDYEQYLHLSDVRRVVEEHEELRIIFGDYIVKPDIVVCRKPVTDSKINRERSSTGQWRGGNPYTSAVRELSNGHYARQCFVQMDDPKRPLTERAHRGLEPSSQPERQDTSHSGRRRGTPPGTHRVASLWHGRYRLHLPLCLKGIDDRRFW